MGTLGDISNLVFQGYRIWQERHAGRTVTPQEMFDKYVAPTYQLLKQVHGNYVDVYLELRERIVLEDPLSPQTVQWFTRERAKLQADRSELRLVQIPQQTGRTQLSKDIDAANSEFLAAVSDYFVPAEIGNSSSRERIERKTPSASSFTAARLHVLHYWSRLSPASQRVFAAEEFFETDLHRLREVMIELLLGSAAGIEDSEITNYVESVAGEADKSFRSMSAIMREGVNEGRFSWVIEGFHWRDILNHHIRVQCEYFEASLRRVQTAYFNLRILTDR